MYIYKKNELYNVFSFFQCFLIILQHLTPIDAQECINSPSSDLLSLTLSYYSSYRENIILILESINMGYKQKKDRSKINGPTIYLYIVLNFYPDLPSIQKSLQKKKKLGN